MTVTPQQFQDWLATKEDEHLEFKEANNNFHFEKLVKYCAALANEGGGSIVLGVTDKRPRQVVGCQAFPTLERTKAGLIERLHLRIDACEINHSDGRVLVFTAPSRPIGMPIAFEGAYWMRAGEDLVAMTPDMLRRIFDEAGPDYSAEICQPATLADLEPRAIEDFRRRWLDKSGNEQLRDTPDVQLLRDAELITDKGITYAALILLGTHAKPWGRPSPNPRSYSNTVLMKPPAQHNNATNIGKDFYSTTTNFGSRSIFAMTFSTIKNVSSCTIFRRSGSEAYEKQF